MSESISTPFLVRFEKSLFRWQKSEAQKGKSAERWKRICWKLRITRNEGIISYGFESYLRRMWNNSETKPAKLLVVNDNKTTKVCLFAGFQLRFQFKLLHRIDKRNCSHFEVLWGFSPPTITVLVVAGCTISLCAVAGDNWNNKK